MAIPILSTMSKKLRRLLPFSAQKVAPSNVVEIGSYATFPEGFHATNPSIVKLGTDYLVCLRGVNYVLRGSDVTNVTFTTGTNYRTINRFLLIRRDFSLGTHLPKLDGIFDDVEDVKLCLLENKIVGIGTISGTPRGSGAAKMALIEICQNLDDAKIRFLRSPFGRDPEKNWAPYDVDGVLNFVYSFHPLVILRYTDESEIVRPWRIGRARAGSERLPFLVGGSSSGLRVGGSYVFATHRRRVSLPLLRHDYVSRLYQIDRAGCVTAMSRHFVIGDHAVQFINGLEQDNNDFIISYGWMDQKAYICRVPKYLLPLRRTRENSSDTLRAAGEGRDARGSGQI